MALTEQPAGTIPATPWQDGLLGCCADPMIILQTICCGPCTFAAMMNRLENDEANCTCFQLCAFMCANGITGGNFVYGLGLGMRRELVQRYNIENEPTWMSYCLGLCCFPCNICQLQREMRTRGEAAGGCCVDAPENEPTMGTSWKERPAKAGDSNGSYSTTCMGCGCCELMDALCCFPCMFGYIANRLDSEKVTTMSLGTDNVMSIPACCLANCNPPMWAFMQRREIIQRYNIRDEGYLKTLVCTTCCLPCAAMQDRREMGKHGHWPGGCCQGEMPE